MSCHYMKDGCCRSCYLHINAAKYGQKFNSTRPPEHWAEKKEVTTWFIGRNRTGKLFFTSLRVCSSRNAVKHQHWMLFHSTGVFLSSHSFPLFPLFDVLCPDRLHMEAKGDTGGLIHCQRHAKAIWAPNQTSRVSYKRWRGHWGETDGKRVKES